ncbi:MAG: winged helix-turn-helix domain-containing protein [Pseudomonadota bacterium]
MRAEEAVFSTRWTNVGRISLGDALLDTSQRSVTVDGTTTSLTDLSWRFLMTLVAQAPEPASSETLCREVWESPHVSPETIAQRARQVRQALGDDPRAPRYIRTIRGGGYQLIPPVESFEDQSQPPLATDPGRRWQVQWFIASGLILTLMYITWSRINAPGEAMTSGSAPTFASSGTVVEQPATDRAGELVRRADDYRLRGIFESNEIAIDLYRRALAEAPDFLPALIGLSLSLSHKTSKYDYSNSHAAQAAELADRALVLNPEDDHAWAARGLADDARGRVSRAMDYYQRALDIEPSGPRYLSNIAYLKQVQGYLHESLRLEAEALSLGPPTFFADFQIAVALRLAGLDDATHRWLDRAETLRPDNVFLLGYQVQQRLVDEQYEQALALLDGAAVDLNDHNFLRGLALRGAGRFEASVSAFREGQRHARTRGCDCVSCIALLVQAQDPEAMTELPAIKRKSQQEIASGNEWPYHHLELAMLTAAEGDPEAAHQHLTRAVALGYRDTSRLRMLQRLGALPAALDLAPFLAQIDDHVAEQRSLIESDPALAGLLDSEQ